MNFNPELCRNESEVESKFLVQYLLPALGYPPECWFQEVALGQIRLDFLVFASRVLRGTPGAPPVRLILEAKHPQRSLDAFVGRLKTYLQSLDVRYGLLTNGRELRVYEFASGDLKLAFQCAGQDVPAHLATLQALIGRSPAQEESPMAVLPPRDEASPSVPTRSAQKESPMKTIAIYHNKGGVGKTTTVVNLAAALAKRGLRVLVVDLDSQANTTYAMGLVQFEDESQDDLRERHVGHVLRYEDLFSIPEVARASRFCNPEVHVLPSHISLMQLESELNMRESSRLMLLSKLRAVQDRYDVVLIDTPPSLNLYARVALIAADYLIIPSDLKPFANQGLINVLDFIRTIDDFRHFINQAPLRVLGVLPSKLSTNARWVETTLKRRRDVIQERYGVPLMNAQIFERDDLAKCTEQVQRLGDAEIPAPVSVLDFKPDSPSALEFELLATEVMDAVGLSRVGASC